MVKFIYLLMLCTYVMILISMDKKDDTIVKFRKKDSIARIHNLRIFSSENTNFIQHRFIKAYNSSEKEPEFEKILIINGKQYESSLVCKKEKIESTSLPAKEDRNEVYWDGSLNDLFMLIRVKDEEIMRKDGETPKVLLRIGARIKTMQEAKALIKRYNFNDFLKLLLLRN
jgi:hypothetical protein